MPTAPELYLQKEQSDLRPTLISKNRRPLREKEIASHHCKTAAINCQQSLRVYLREFFLALNWPQPEHIDV